MILRVNDSLTSPTGKNTQTRKKYVGVHNNITRRRSFKKTFSTSKVKISYVDVFNLLMFVSFPKIY